jgi:hypothetical protein
MGKNLSQVFIDFVETNLNMPVVATAYGPKLEDRKVMKGHESLFTSV